MQLSKRLQVVAEQVSYGNRVADIGCDHAYVAIYLVENHIASKVIAMDVNQGPLERAKENIRKYGYEDQIDVRLSDGIQKLSVGEADTLLIAGMGGPLTLQILSGRRDILGTVKELVLQPQSEIHLVRKALKGLGFLITSENMLVEDGKYYVCMKAEAIARVNDSKNYELTEEEHYYCGRLLLERKEPVLLEFLQRELQQREVINQNLTAFPTEQSMLRQKELIEEMELINRGIRYYAE